MEERLMKKMFAVVSVLLIATLLLAACAQPTPTAAPTTAAPTEAPTVVATTVAPTAAPAGLTCAQPIKIGLITDASGALASYGEMMMRSFMLGMEYATGKAGSAGDVFSFAKTQENTFK